MTPPGVSGPSPYGPSGPSPSGPSGGATTPPPGPGGYAAGAPGYDAGTPGHAAGTPQGSSGKGPVVLVVVIIVLAAMLGVGVALLLTRGSSSDTEVSTQPTERPSRSERTSTTTAPPTTTTTTQPDMSALEDFDLFALLPEETGQAVFTRLLQEPELRQALEDASDAGVDPPIDATIQLMEIIIENGGREVVEELIFSEAEGTPEELACVRELAASFDDGGLVIFIEGLLVEDTATINLMAPCFSA